MKYDADTDKMIQNWKNNFLFWCTFVTYKITEENKDQTLL